MNCFNRFGESLLHMDCRRGFEDTVEFLLDQPEVDVRICDDNGRTILHDACWNPLPQLKTCRRILQRDPTLLFISDNRGCSAFQYARREKRFLDALDPFRCFALERLSKAVSVSETLTY
jgi:ankyrin repeat protein